MTMMMWQPPRVKAEKAAKEGGFLSTIPNFRRCLASNQSLNQSANNMQCNFSSLQNVCQSKTSAKRKLIVANGGWKILPMGGGWLIGPAANQLGR